MPRTVPPRPKAKCFLLTFLFIGRPISHPSFDQSKCQRFKVPVVLQLCASVASQGGNSMARKVGQIIARGDRRWLIRVYLGRDRETQKPPGRNSIGCNAPSGPSNYLSAND